MAENANQTDQLSVDVSREGDTVTLAVAGELDLATQPRLVAALVPVAPGGRMVVDLRGLSFIDSTGIRTLMELDVRSRLEGWKLVIARSPGPVQRVLDLCSVSERVLTVDDPAAAE